MLPCRTVAARLQAFATSRLHRGTQLRLPGGRRPRCLAGTRVRPAADPPADGKVNQGVAHVGCRVRTLVERMLLAASACLLSPRGPRQATCAFRPANEAPVASAAWPCCACCDCSAASSAPSASVRRCASAAAVTSCCSSSQARRSASAATTSLRAAAAVRPLARCSASAASRSSRGCRAFCTRAAAASLVMACSGRGRPGGKPSQLFGDRSRRARRGPAGACVRRAGPPLPLNSHTAQHRTSPALTCAARSCAASTWRCSACSMSP